MPQAFDDAVADAGAFHQVGQLVAGQRRQHALEQFFLQAPDIGRAKSTSVNALYDTGDDGTGGAMLGASPSRSMVSLIAPVGDSGKEGLVIGAVVDDLPSAEPVEDTGYLAMGSTGDPDTQAANNADDDRDWDSVDSGGEGGSILF